MGRAGGEEEEQVGMGKRGWEEGRGGVEGEERVGRGKRGGEREEWVGRGKRGWEIHLAYRKVRVCCT